MRRWPILFLAALVVPQSAIRIPHSAAAGPVPPKDAPARMTVPEGFRVTLFAGEPDVVQPIAFTFDDRGRMWVVECLSYPKWRADGKGNDRVVILEDADGDGRFDKKTVFLDTGSNLSGIELGFGGIYLCSTPNLLFIPVKDDKPAGPPEVLLDGWNLKEAKHNVFNGLGWGPDGWLYGCNGIQTKSWVGKPGTPQKDRTYLDCGVWRYHPTRKVFEVVASGTTNPWGLDWDDYGEMFITNCVIDHLWHVVPGGHYQRMYGQDANPYAFGLMGPASDHKHWAGGHWTTARADLKTGAVTKAHDDAGGGHAHSGCAIYLGDNFPAEYRNSVFMCNIHGNRLNRDSLHRTPAGYVGKHEKDFLFANDPWFRGICVKQGPEGALYVSDWTDTGECHNYDKADTTNGRIYRVAYGAPKPLAGDVTKMTDAELVKLQLSKNEWLVRHARRVLQERAAAGALAADATKSLTDSLTADPDVARRLRALWALEATGRLTAADLRGLLSDRDEAVRAWGYQLALDGSPERNAGVLPAVGETAGREASEFVRTAAAGFLQRTDPQSALGLAAALFRNPHPVTDPNLALMLWYGVAPAYAARPEDAVAALPAIPVPLVREYAVRLVLTRPGVPIEGMLDRLAAELAKPGPFRADALRGIREALAGRKGLTPPPAWADAFSKLAADPAAEVRDLAEQVGLLLGDRRAADAALARATDPAAPADARRAALDRLVARKTPGLAPALRGLLADPAVRGAAVRGLAAYPDADTPAAILRHYPAFTPDEKADAIQTLAARPAFAAALLDAIEHGAVPKADVTAFAARQIQALNDPAVRDKLARVWGTVQPASKTRAAQTAKLKAKLTPDVLKAADLANGRALFTRTCAACHRMFGEGGDVGPELTGSQRANLDYLLENVLDPNAVVPFDYKMTAFYLTDGRVVTGLVRKETPQAVTVRTANEEVVLPKEDVESRKATPNSVMPEGLLDPLKDDDVRDLIAYLASPRQVPAAGK